MLFSRTLATKTGTASFTVYYIQKADSERGGCCFYCSIISSWSFPCSSSHCLLYTSTWNMRWWIRMVTWQVAAFQIIFYCIAFHFLFYCLSLSIALPFNYSSSSLPLNYQYSAHIHSLSHCLSLSILLPFTLYCIAVHLLILILAPQFPISVQ